MFVTQIVALAMFARINVALKSLTHATHHLAALEQLVWSILWVTQSAGMAPISFNFCLQVAFLDLKTIYIKVKLDFTIKTLLHFDN